MSIKSIARVVLAVVFIHVASVYAQPSSNAPISLAGQWRFSLDRNDEGVKSQWFNNKLSDQIQLPGILQGQGFGDEISVDTPWVAALPRDMAWYKLPQYKAFTQPGHIEMPYLSQPPRHYLGVAWYQRDIDIPANWQNRRVMLTLERTRWQSSVWVDDKSFGSYESFVAPHLFDLGVLAPGTHQLSIRIDNDTRKITPPYRPDGHSVSDSEGATWNGIVGRIELSSTSSVWIDDAQAFPDVAAKSVRIKVTIGNATGNAGSASLSVGKTSTTVQWDAKGGSGELVVPLAADAQTWSEFTPVLQHLTVTLTGTDANDQRDISFGLREIKRDGQKMLLNGTQIEVRATHDGGGFPLTGYPAMDVDDWKKIISTAKEYGLNGMRFHSWCPPEAAFEAADELGFYIQPECGMWNSFDTGDLMLNRLNDETARILKAYGNHPSFVLLSPTNEPAGHYQEQLPTWVNKWRDADPRRLYTTGTGRPSIPQDGADKGNDFLIMGFRGPSGWFGRDFETQASRVAVPTLAHELGQWCAYPDYSIIDKFTGYLQPSNYIVARDSAAAHGLLDRNKEIAHASGRFQVACYKEEIEANERTKSYSGFELLDLHDYLGQGTALIGLLDAFWESKGYFTSDEMRRFCNTTVVLARLPGSPVYPLYTTSQTIDVPLEVSNFGPAPITGAATQWKIVEVADQHVVTSGEFPAISIPIGKGTALGDVKIDLTKFDAPRQYKLIAGLEGTTFENDWNFWVYPANIDSSTPSDVLVTSKWDDAQTALAGGGKVLFLPPLTELDDANPTVSGQPVFWNTVMNPQRTYFLGLWCDAKNPALAEFPTEENCDWQWVDLFNAGLQRGASSRSINLDKLPRDLQPIVQSIDDWNRNFKLGLIYECKVGTGKLMVSALNLQATNPAMQSLRKSLLDYMASAKFNPTVDVPLQDIRNQWRSTRAAEYVSEAAIARPTQQQSPDVVNPAPVTRP